MCKPCVKSSLFGRILLPSEVKAGEEFVITLEVKSVGGVFEGVNSRLALPSYVQTTKTLGQEVGTLQSGGSINISWHARVDESVEVGEYPLEAYIYSSVDTMMVRSVLRVREVSLVREFREGVFAFMENSLKVVSENPSAVLLTVAVMAGLAYIYYRFRK